MGTDGLMIDDISSINRKQFYFQKYNGENSESFLMGCKEMKWKKKSKQLLHQQKVIKIILKLKISIKSN